MAKIETVRLNINVAKELMDKVDDYAEKMAINRTSAVAVLLSNALNTQQTMSDLSELLKIVEEERKKQNQAEQTN